MTQKSNFQEYIYPVLILAFIAAFATLCLAVTNSISAPIIEINAAKAADAARKEVFSSAESFNKFDVDEYVSTPDGSAQVTDIYVADDESGCVMTVHTNSFGGDLTMMVGIDVEGKITGVKVTDHNDTPGVGTKDQAPEYLAQYFGKSGLSGTDVKKEEGFSYISGASVSGTAIHKGVYAALEQFGILRKNHEGGGQ